MCVSKCIIFPKKLSALVASAPSFHFSHTHTHILATETLSRRNGSRSQSINNKSKEGCGGGALSEEWEKEPKNETVRRTWKIPGSHAKNPAQRKHTHTHTHAHTQSVSKSLQGAQRREGIDKNNQCGSFGKPDSGELSVSLLSFHRNLLG